MTTRPPNALRIAVVYYSARGNVHGLARAVADGAASVGVEVRLRHVAELNQELHLREAVLGPAPLRDRAWLVGKVATAFTSSQTEHGGQESTTLALNNTLCHQGAIIVPLGYTVHEGFNGGENPYGASFTESYTRTSVVRGIFRKKAEARAEALELLPAA
jgi:NAD(P)H dehydrogenase (quinone)